MGNQLKKLSLRQKYMRTSFIVALLAMTTTEYSAVSLNA